MKGNRQTSSIRTLLFIANVFGLIIGLIGFGVFIYAMTRVGLMDPKATGDISKTSPYVPLIFSVVTFAFVTNTFFCLYIINFLKKADDITLLNNRYIIALFSISIGGIFTPFVLAQMQNIPVESTISPKFTISKGYGGNSLVAGFSALIVYFGFSLLWYKQNIFASGLADIILVSVLAVVLFWGVLNCLVFATPGALATWNKKETAYKFMNFIAVINLIVATIILIMQLIQSILSIISIFADMFDRKRGFLGTIFNSMYAAYRIAIQLFIIYTINKIIKGIWAKGDQVQYNDYSKLAEKQREYDMAN
ncbi:hypothetical protein [Spiroplasma floricola]|uniref:Transmembrane protein n=1 Tax=Spiroplasma floricola 23-6 TaxID=1336749 RepID=A0A2K8SEV5_9MOLU|nr:hypothetical protein [Spiroplasma floricola]AUB31962.1 hypothetical protein SFLOR_v1c09140 [Spiroplasma floricola 23-6]